MRIALAAVALAAVIGCGIDEFDPSVCGGTASGTYALLDGSPLLPDADYEYMRRGLECQGWEGTAADAATADDVVAAFGSDVDLVYYTGHGTAGKIAVDGFFLDLSVMRIRARAVVLSACEVLGSDYWIDAEPGTAVMGYAGKVDTRESARVALEMLRGLRDGLDVVDAFTAANESLKIQGAVVKIFYKEVTRDQI